MRKVLSKFILVLTFLCFGWLFVNSFRYSSNVFYSENPFFSLIISIVILIVWYFIYMLLKRKIPDDLEKKYRIIFLVCYFVLVTVVQLIVIFNFSVEPGWDFGVVFNNAYNFVLDGSRSNAVYTEYFEYFPNNIMLFVLLVVFIKCGLMCGISAIQSAWIMNILFIDIALLLLFLVVNKKYNFKVAIFTLIISFFFLPIFLYTPVFYSDTLSMFVGIGLVYLYLILNEDKTSKKKSVLILILIGILTFFGKEMKVTSLIVLIAILVHLLFNSGIKKFILSFTTIALVFVISSIIFKLTIVNNSKFEFKQTGYGSYPYTHWLMMGVEDIDSDNTGRNSIGGYNSKDYDLTRSYKSGKDAINFNLEEYARRVKKMGIKGYFDYLTRKGVNAWSDGLYFSNIKLTINHRSEHIKLYNFFLTDENTKYILIYFSQGVQFSFLILLIIGSLKSCKQDVDYIRLSILGLMIFLLFWENRSRYLVNFIPLFILIIAEFYYELDRFKEKKENICLKLKEN